jgi:hypothetical protein
MGDAICSLQTGSTAPEEIWIRCKNGHAHESILHGLIRKVEKGLSAISMEQDIDTHRSSCRRCSILILILT